MGREGGGKGVGWEGGVGWCGGGVVWCGVVVGEREEGRKREEREGRRAIIPFRSLSPCFTSSSARPEVVDASIL